MSEPETVAWLKDRLEILEQKRRDLQKDKEAIDTVEAYIKEEIVSLESKYKVIHPFNLGGVAGTVELLKKEKRWMDKAEISKAFLAGGYKSTAQNPAESLASTLNSEVRDNNKKGSVLRIVKKNGRYGLPEWIEDSSIPLFGSPFD